MSQSRRQERVKKSLFVPFTPGLQTVFGAPLLLVVSFRQGCAQQSGADVYHSFFDDWSSGVLGQGGSIVPGHPTAWLPDQISRVPLEFGQVLEGVHSTQFTGMDQTHEQIADLRPV